MDKIAGKEGESQGIFLVNWLIRLVGPVERAFDSGCVQGDRKKLIFFDKWT